MVWSSTPNTMGPTMLRTRASSSASRVSASVSLAALAVIRTFRPSMPLARKASVGPPSVSRRSISSARSSASPDSDWPHVRSVRDRMTLAIPARRFRSGRTVPSTIWRISQGTPGTA